MKLQRQKSKTQQKGAVSLFIVIFTALLITTITVSFMQLMVKDQRQAMYSDLSESAYDSATAGVEDAKRLLLMQQDCIGDSSRRCADIRSAVGSGECTTLSEIFGGSPNGEAAIIQTEGDRRLEQAYTCVKIATDTPDYLGSIEPDATGTLIPLRAKGGFNKIVISWALSKSGTGITLPAAGVKTLPARGSAAWPESYPALLRTQLIHGHGANFKLSDFDNSGYSNTLFLYPSSSGIGTADFSLDGRRGGAEPQLVRCNARVGSGDYACKFTINISPAVSAGSQTAFLNLATFYKGTDYRIELMNGDAIVSFDGVQPEVDSTGRANDLFRRVVSRVELNNTFKYPVAALETRNSICKNFSITTEESGYSSSLQCSPTN